MVPIGVCLETVFTDLSAEERIAKIAQAGYRRAKKDHTYIKRFRKILKQVELKC